MHVTEEQAAMDETMGNTPPDIEQGTPVQEVSLTQNLPSHHVMLIFVGCK